MVLSKIEWVVNVDDANQQTPRVELIKFTPCNSVCETNQLVSWERDSFCIYRPPVSLGTRTYYNCIGGWWVVGRFYTESDSWIYKKQNWQIPELQNNNIINSTLSLSLQLRVLWKCHVRLECSGAPRASAYHRCGCVIIKKTVTMAKTRQSVVSIDPSFLLLAPQFL